MLCHLDQERIPAALSLSSYFVSGKENHWWTESLKDFHNKLSSRPYYYLWMTLRNQTTILVTGFSLIFEPAEVFENQCADRRACKIISFFRWMGQDLWNHLIENEENRHYRLYSDIWDEASLYMEKYKIHPNSKEGLDPRIASLCPWGNQQQGVTCFTLYLEGQSNATAPKRENSGGFLGAREGVGVVVGFQRNHSIGAVC